MESNASVHDENTDMDLVNTENGDDISLDRYEKDLPAQIEKHLDFVAANKSGYILLGSSNLTGRYWCGSVWYYTDPFLAPQIEGSKAAIEFTTGVTDCAFIDENKAIIGQDGGYLDFIVIKETDLGAQIEKIDQIEDHGRSVISVKIICDGTAAVTASMDMSIRVWDCHTTALKHNFTPAHTQEVTSLATHPHRPDLLLSSSLDGNVLLWDLRAPKPASCVFRDVDNCPSAVSFAPSVDGGEALHFVVGTSDGHILLREASVLSESLAASHAFKRPVFRIEPNQARPSEFVACANETKIQAFTVQDEKIRKTYCDDRHEDFVRGLTWLNDCCVLSCGWDKNVFCHALPPT